ncbi:MAG: hypothetical protein LBD57_04445 [Endomicrobium sp.]|uniref:hypothetical protein n=1 Tax=Candidatus Endomicrobiellum cubanum TaxID=3242325 RepID=UPI002829DD7C|nr:hypothetical protein [Endomicrobium sp.]
MIANIVLENPKFIYKNFSGKVTQHNVKGMRNFCVILNQETVDAISKDGWHIKYLKNYKEDGLIPYLKVSINYNYINKPEIIVLSSDGKTILNEDNIGILDKVEIKNSKLIIRSYTYDKGLKDNVPANIIAYLKSLEIRDLFISANSNIGTVVTDADKKPVINDNDEIEPIKEKFIDGVAID